MQKLLSLLTVLTVLSFNSQAQFTRYIIRFKDKGGNPFSIGNPSQYLSQRALDRRTKYNIAVDSIDLPVTPSYIDSIRLSGNVTILNVSKWLNQVAIQTSDAMALNKINGFPFVISTTPVAARKPGTLVNKKLDVPFTNVHLQAGRSTQRINDYYNYGQSERQVKIHNGDFLHNHGFRGEGMQMAVLDAGFYHYLSLPTFDSIRINNQVLGTWDFVANEEEVNADDSHGMHCLSIIAANIPGAFVGAAPKTSFYLYRTEDVASEYPVEEQNWAAGVEKADSIGVDITTTSLGYYDFDGSLFDYAYQDMNGNTSISAKVADIASAKGLLMVAAAGNEGNSSWHYLITPSDADSILSVGAVNVAGNVGGFSSYGPSSDGQVKPAVAAVGVGTVIANVTTGQPDFGSGTSYACPNIAGIATCLWQAFPEVNNMGIIDALEAAATRANDPDDRVGYGIPDAKKAFVLLQMKTYSQQAIVTNCTAALKLQIKTDNTMSILVERKVAGETSYTSITSLQNTGSYGLHDFEYNEDLGSLTQGVIHYRFNMIIAGDSTFYLDSLTVNNTQDCAAVISENSVTVIQQNESAENVGIVINRVTPARITILIHNPLGQKVYSKQFEQVAGSQKQMISLNKIFANRGAYFLSVFIDNKKVITKAIINP